MEKTKKESLGQLSKALALLGGGWATVLGIYLVLIQFNMGAVIKGQMPVAVAYGFGKDSLPYLAALLAIGFATILFSLLPKINAVLLGSFLVLFGGILLYGSYLARFSAGLLLFPAAVTILLAGLIILVQGMLRRSKAY
jgi:hypothetical protein